MTVETTTKDKQITIDVPEDRVPEFYAFYAHFLAGSSRRRGGPHPRGPRGHRGPGRHGHCCGHHGEHEHADESAPVERGEPGPGPETVA